MDAPSPTPERSRELADLRRRAYGPDADIQRDPTALLRLNELEDLVRENPEAVDDSLPPIGVEEDLDEQPETAGAQSRPALIPEAPRRGRSRIPKWSIAAIAVVAGIVIGASALWLIQRSTSMESPPDLTLKPTSSGSSRGPGFVQNLDFWGVDRGTVSAYEPFDSIGVWTALSNDGSRCLILSSEGQIFTATCAAKDLDPIFDLTINSNIHVYFDGILPEGSVVRFVARAGGVDVWVRPAAASPPTPSS